MEVALSLDYDTSRILEKLLYLLNSVDIRIFTDKLMGNYLELTLNVFASHVVQTLLIIASDIMHLECIDPHVISPVISTVIKQQVQGVGEGEGVGVGEAEGDEVGDGEETGEGTLQSMTNLFLNIISELLPHLNHLISDKYASHIVRLIIQILKGSALDNAAGRSKKSKEFNEKMSAADWRVEKGKVRPTTLSTLSSTLYLHSLSPHNPFT
jgi:nucleolar protein 9